MKWFLAIVVAQTLVMSMYVVYADELTQQGCMVIYLMERKLLSIKILRKN